MCPGAGGVSIVLRRSERRRDRESTCAGPGPAMMMASMTNGPPQARAAASRVAKGLLKKGQSDEAVAVLAVWAVTGGNDAEGQNLLAEALRIDPSSRLAKLAFERMEGIAGDHKALEEAIAHWSAEEIARIDGEMA